MSRPIKPDRREPVFNMPASVIGAIVVLLGVQAGRHFLSPAVDFTLLLEWGFVPAQWSFALGRLSASEIVNGAVVGSGEGASDLGRAMANLVLGPGFDPGPWAPFTYAMLHGSWSHVVLNCVWLAAFATPVVRRAGWPRSGALAILTAFAGALAHWLVHPAGVAPLIGASAIVSGFMAAAATFVFDPFPVAQAAGATRFKRALASLFRLSRNRTALIFLGVWLVLNFASSFFTGALGISEASIAWEAHLGGFAVGLMLFPLIDPGLSRRET